MTEGSYDAKWDMYFSLGLTPWWMHAEPSLTLSRPEELAIKISDCGCDGRGVVSNAQSAGGAKLPDVTTLRSRVTFKDSDL